MTRVVAGTFKGRRLRTPPGDATRPTSDRVRESLFASLTSYFGGLDELRVLDLFAGSGAIGIEAVSRGAAQADLVDADRHAVRTIRTNLAELGVEQARVHAVKAERFVRTAPLQPYDLVVLDPPYAVSTAVNKVQNNSPALLEPLTEDATGAADDGSAATLAPSSPPGWPRPGTWPAPSCRLAACRAAARWSWSANMAPATRKGDMSGRPQGP